MTWECEVCGHKNPDSENVCEECGSYREEPAYDIESDLEDEESPKADSKRPVFR